MESQTTNTTSTAQCIGAPGSAKKETSGWHFVYFIMIIFTLPLDFAITSPLFLFCLLCLDLFPDLLLHLDAIISVSSPICFLAPFVAVASLKQKVFYLYREQRGVLLPFYILRTCCFAGLLHQHGRTSRCYLHWHWHCHWQQRWLQLELQHCLVWRADHIVEPVWLSLPPSESSWSFSFVLHLDSPWDGRMRM